VGFQLEQATTSATVAKSSIFIQRALKSRPSKVTDSKRFSIKPGRVNLAALVHRMDLTSQIWKLMCKRSLQRRVELSTI